MIYWDINPKVSIIISSNYAVMESYHIQNDNKYDKFRSAMLLPKFF
ncbi:MAG: hypothetical protein RLZZ66_2057 [Pseudomonadota bacterium]|jgi:hypothetical protein